ncbi:MAG: peptidoglycan DD-metalloendopeptidase family protein [Succinivibrio sp.]|nr:peptidoglycan DD-metalloendopeptidase family protein [Succinivibrio sp.]
MLNIRINKKKISEDYVAVTPNTGIFPFPARHVIGIVSVCVMSFICAIPINDNVEDFEADSDSLSLFALFGDTKHRFQDKKELEQIYLSADEQNAANVEMASSAGSQENYDEEVFPTSFFNNPATASEDSEDYARTETDEDSTLAILASDTKPRQEEHHPVIPEQRAENVSPEEDGRLRRPFVASNSTDDIGTNSLQELLRRSQQTALFPEITVQEIMNGADLVAETPAQESEADTEAPGVTDTAAEKDEVRSVPAQRPSGKWYSQTVKKGDTLSKIFYELNLPSQTLKKITSAAKKKDLVMSVGDKIHFLVDENNIVMEMVKPLPNGKQIRFTRMDVDNDFATVYEGKNEHVESADLIKTFELASNMPLAIQGQKEREEKAKEEAERKRLEAIALAEQQKKEEEEFREALKHRPQLIVATVEAKENFSQTAKRMALGKKEIATITAALSGKINLKKLRSGDSFRVLFTASGGKGQITAIEIKSRKQGTVSVFRHPKNGTFYGEREYQPTAGVFRRFPLQGTIKVNSPFNPHRFNPVLHRIAPHNGVDFKVQVGTPVYAPADGEVTFAGYMRGGGYVVILKHANNFSTVYMHLSKFDVKKGQKVNLGQIIARSGNTGRSTGAHLHYEVRINDRPVDPLTVDLPNNRTPKMAQAEKAAFDEAVKNLKASLYNSSLTAAKN